MVLDLQVCFTCFYGKKVCLHSTYFLNFSYLFTFSDRSDAFDMNMSLNEHFKSLRVDDEIAKESEEPREQLDLSLKEGQTIKVCTVL